jgi:hypothetical protein
MASGDQPPFEPAGAEEPDSATPPDVPVQKGESMDIHPPHGSIHTKKDFFIHLLTIIAGILIALGLEALITWGHHRTLVGEARANLAMEIRNNKETVDRALTEMRNRKQGLVEIIRAMQTLEAGKPGPKGLNYIFVGYDLYSTAWTTATASGATAHMDYEQLKRYTDLYNLQQIFMNLQYQAFAATAEISDLRWIMDRDPKSISKARIEQIETASARYLTILEALTDAAEQLSKKYEAFT